ncbi:MAG: response regulator [Acidobacteriota bacterium]|nr:response regulator [Acidobacteriota bacterium]
MVNQSQHTILVVNDSPDQLKLVEIVLRQADYNVLTAASGNQAFNFIKTTIPDLIISDVMMPDGDGIELCRQIRADEKLQTLPILLISALRKDAASVVEGLNVGADDYIESPFDSMHLVARASRLIERKQMEDELRRSRERYHHFIKQSTEGIWRIEFNETIPTSVPIENQTDMACRHGFYAECNDAMAQMYGFESAEDLVGRYFTELLIASDDNNQNFIRDFIENGYRLNDAESHELDKFGQEKYFLNNLVGVVVDGALASVWGTQRDVTYKKQAERALRESEEKFKAQYVGIPIPTYTWRKAEDDFILINCNNAAEKITDGKILDFIGIRATRMYDDLPKMVEDFHKCFDGKRPHRREMLYKYRVDGRERYLDFNYAFVPPDMVMVHTRDITEQKQAETALIEANERAIREYNTLLQRLAKLGQAVSAARDLNAIFSAILDFTRASAPCSALVVSLYEEKKKLRKVIYCWYNDEELNVSGIEPVPVGEGIVGQAVETGEVVIVNDYESIVQKRCANVSIGFDKDSRHPQSSIIAPLNIKGSCIGVIEVQSYESSVYKDEHATAMSMAANFIANAIENVRLLELERQREEQLRQSQKLESVGRLAGGIAHDFNNMLTAINGYSNLTLRRLKDEDPLRHNIEEIKKAGERSAALTHQLLAFSRKQVLKPEVLDINQSVGEISFMLKRLIGEDVQLVSALSQEIGQVKVDPGQLSQVIMNLAVNARDAMPQGGALTIETKNVYLDEEFAASHVPTVAGHYVMLAVSDTGSGIAPEMQEHIFEPFFTTKEVGKGTGLGLATVYGIVKQSGGFIWVDSELGCGTTFKIYLPRVDENFDTERKYDTTEEMAAGTEKIMLVEDEQMVRDLTRQILEDCGYAVIEASNGAEAFELCSQDECEIDLLMTDVVMPKIGGRELAEKLAETHPQMKVLFTSGYTDDSVVRHGVIQAGTNFIQKPYSPTDLALKVRTILDTGNKNEPEQQL